MSATIWHLYHFTNRNFDFNKSLNFFFLFVRKYVVFYKLRDKLFVWYGCSFLQSREFNANKLFTFRANYIPKEVLHKIRLFFSNLPENILFCISCGIENIDYGMKLDLLLKSTEGHSDNLIVIQSLIKETQTNFNTTEANRRDNFHFSYSDSKCD